MPPEFIAFTFSLDKKQFRTAEGKFSRFVFLSKFCVFFSSRSERKKFAGNLEEPREGKVIYHITGGLMRYFSDKLITAESSINFTSGVFKMHNWLMSPEMTELKLFLRDWDKNFQGQSQYSLSLVISQISDAFSLISQLSLDYVFVYFIEIFFSYSLLSEIFSFFNNLLQIFSLSISPPCNSL